MIKEAVQEYYINIFPKNLKVKLVLRFVTGAVGLLNEKTNKVSESK